ncbi:MAG TPA: AAA family ATPase [Thermoanaerobaculia bacterium]|nr:AAA family ATPase [Thermoanaerobaculia bacterium]
MSAREAAALAEPAPIENPFPGLRSFEPDEDHLFFGRETQIDELLARLRRTRLLAVVGTSGSGKSSLVRSGVIPSLHSGFMVQAGSSWRIAILRPGSDPIGNLAAALDGPDVLGGDPEHADVSRALLETTLHRSAHGLADAVRQARMPEDQNLLIVVDQFEELFRFKNNRQIEDSGDQALAFVKLLLDAAGQAELPVFVVVTMRSDFIGNCTEFPGLAEAINDGQYLVPRMTREERRSAIVGPVAVGGAEIAPRLVTRLLNDVGDDPDQLPTLQHALMRTWDYWRRHHAPGEPLDLRHYEVIGALSEALSQHAEEAYRELADDEERRIAEVLFKALTDRGSDARGIRRPCTLEEICALAAAPAERVVPVVETFRHPGRSFLMPPAGTALGPTTILDISHESLMRIWTRLIDWVEEEARAAQIYLRLSRAAARYQEGTAGLLRDPELQLSLNWREETRPTATWGERYDVAFERAMLYLDYSEKERDLYLERRERERRRQLRRARWVAVILGSAAAATLAFGMFAFIQGLEAEENAREALRQQRDAELQRLEAERQQGEAEHQRLAAEEARSTAESERRAADEQRTIAESERLRALSEEERAIEQRRQAEQARVEAEAARGEAETQRGRALTEKERAERLRAQAEVSEAEAQRLARLQLARALAFQTNRMQQEAQREPAALLALHAFRLNRASGGRAADPAIHSALRQGLERLAPESHTAIRHHGDAVRAVAVAPDGRTAASGSDDGGVRVFDLDRPGEPPALLERLEGGVRALAFSPDGARLAAGGLDGAIRIWTLGQSGSGRLLGGGPAHAGGLSSLAFDPAGRRLASAGYDGRVLLWDLERGAATPLLTEHPHRLQALDFEAGGGRLAVASEGGGVLLLDAAGGAPPVPLAAGRKVRAVAFGPSGRTLAAGTADGLVLLWQVSPGGAPAAPATLAGHASGVTDLAFGDEGLLASSSLDGMIRLWDARDPGLEPTVVPAHGDWIWSVAIAAGSDRMVSGGADRIVRVLPSTAAALAEALCAQLSRELTPEEWRDYLPADLERAPACPPGAPR